MQTGRSPSDAGASAPEADERHERPLRVESSPCRWVSSVRFLTTSRQLSMEQLTARISPENAGGHDTPPCGSDRGSQEASLQDRFSQQLPRARGAFLVMPRWPSAAVPNPSD